MSWTALLSLHGTWISSGSDFNINQLIKDNYLIVPQKRLAAMIGRSDSFLRNRMKKLGLVIPREIIEQRKQDSRIKPGNIPPNKGKKLPAYVYEKVKPTMFKKGSIPPNTKYDGYISIRVDNHGHPYKHIRLAKGKFELLHRKVWMDEHGPIPVGCVVAFKNGDTLDIRLENLMMITRQENMKRNSIHNYPEDIRHNIQLIGVLNRQINKITRKNEKQQHDCTKGSPV